MMFSICIPTWNRASQLDRLLQSIWEERIDELEIVVSDNASSDNTREVIRRWEDQGLRIVYHCWPENVGFDRNAMKVVEKASGEYCWCLGSDDLVAPGGIRAIYDYLKSSPVKPSLLTFEYVSVDRNLAVLAPPSRIAGDVKEEAIVIADGNQSLMRVAELLGLYSVCAVNRKMWNELDHDRKWEHFCNGFVHLYMRFRLLQTFGNWAHLTKVCFMSTRVDDLAAMLKDRPRRLAFDLQGWSRITEELFSNSPVGNFFRKVEMNLATGTLYQWIRMGSPLKERAKFLALFLGRYFWSPRTWYFAFPVILTPAPVLCGLRQGKLRGFFKRLMFQQSN
jgi:abequosyltransferase